jgi:hypothetical protein
MSDEWDDFSFDVPQLTLGGDDGGGQQISDWGADLIPGNWNNPVPDYWDNGDEDSQFAMLNRFAQTGNNYFGGGNQGNQPAATTSALTGGGQALTQDQLMKILFPGGTQAKTEGQPDWFKASQSKLQPGSLVNLGGLNAGQDTATTKSALEKAFEEMQRSIRNAGSRAQGDRNQALASAGNVSSYLNSDDVKTLRAAVTKLQTNPFGPDWQAAQVEQQREERIRQLATAEANLQQQYAARGMAVPPRLSALMREKVMQAANADLRNLQIESATQSYNADVQAASGAGNLVNSVGSLTQAANQALYNVLANTNYQPDTATMQLLARLAGEGGQAAGYTGGQLDLGGRTTT